MSGPLFSSEKPGYGSTNNGGGGDADILAICSRAAVIWSHSGWTRVGFVGFYIPYAAVTHDSAESLPGRSWSITLRLTLVCSAACGLKTPCLCQRVAYRVPVQASLTEQASPPASAVYAVRGRTLWQRFLGFRSRQTQGQFETVQHGINRQWSVALCQTLFCACTQPAPDRLIGCSRSDRGMQRTAVVLGHHRLLCVAASLRPERYGLRPPRLYRCYSTKAFQSR